MEDIDPSVEELAQFLREKYGPGRTIRAEKVVELAGRRILVTMYEPEAGGEPGLAVTYA